MYVFFAKFTYNEYIRSYFLSHFVSTIFASDLPVRCASFIQFMVVIHCCHMVIVPK